MIYTLTLLLAVHVTLVLSDSIYTVPISRPSNRKRLSRLSYSQYQTKNSTSILSKSFLASNATKLKNYGDTYFTAKIKIGTGQIFTVDLDTGSSDLWLRGPTCTSSDGSCEGRNQLSKKLAVDVKHKAVKFTTKSFSITYGSGAVAGNVYNTTVSIQGINVTMPIGVSTRERGFGSLNADGLLGLGFPKLNKIEGSNFMESAGSTGLSKTFGFYLSNSANGDEGEFTFGGYDPKKFKGNITWLPVVEKSYWGFSTDGGSFQIGKASGKLSGTYIADTGTSLMIFPDDLADEINTEIGAKVNLIDGNYYVDCSVAKKGPDLRIKIGSGKFSVPANICKIFLTN
jgi:hypothetical protein